MKKEIRLSGSGGQGLILAGIILAEGAIMSKLNAVQSQSYGPEARGGASKSEVILCDEEINFPKVRKPDMLLSLTQKSYNEYSKDLKEDGILIVDSSIKLNSDLNIKNTYKIPMIKTARESIGREMVSNIVALGAIGEVLDIIDKENLKKAILGRVPKGTEELNIRAFEEGALLIKNI
jgi:2-oxoglutarate ferredoxin oxidoreductase subunit gamma